MTLLLRRKISYHLLQTFLPSGLFVIVAWLSLFLPPESIPGRVTMAMTTLLTLAAMFGAVRYVIYHIHNTQNEIRFTDKNAQSKGNFYILRQTRMLRNDYFMGFFLRQ